MNNCIGEALPEQIARFILEEIMNGTLKPGEKIIEEKVSSVLNVSRAPVREALYLLQMSGIVERIPRRGTLVRNFSRKELKDVNEVLIGLVQMAIEMSKDKWESIHSNIWLTYKEELQKEYEDKSIIGYSEKIEKLLRYFFIIAENKVLLKYFNETNYILNVFSKVKWTVETLENVHQDLKLFCDAMIESNIDSAEIHIKRALRKPLQ